MNCASYITWSNVSSNLFGIASSC